MSFLIQGKTNWKYILILVILAVVVGGGIFGYFEYLKKEIISFTQFPEIKKLEKVVKKETTEEFFRIIQPEVNQKITSPVQIKGEANLSENEILKEGLAKGLFDRSAGSINILISDGFGHTIGYGNIPTKNGSLKGLFNIEVSYTPSLTQKGVITMTRFLPIKGVVPTKGFESLLPETLLEIPVIFETLGKCSNLYFEDYPVTEIYKGKIADVDFESYPAAYMFQTKIKEGAKRGPNFAGQYTVITWGCGASCGESAIVNSKTGKIVYFDLPSRDINFNLNSRLLINYAGLLPSTEEGMIEFYELKDDKLELICKNY